MTTLFEESEPVASPRGWTLTVRIDQIRITPGGSRQALRSESYNYQRGADNESDELQHKRLEKKRNARGRALDKFDEAKMEAKRARRRKAARPAAASSPALPPPGEFASPAVLPVAPVVALPDFDDADDAVTRRDWALLRAWKQDPSPEAVLLSLRAQGLDCDEEPWTVARVQERHAFLCRSVRVACRLVGASPCQRTVRTLACLCA